MTKTSSKSTGYEVNDPGISQPASYIEVLDRKLSNEKKTEQAAELSAASVVSPVEVRAINRAGDDTLHVVAREPTSQLFLGE